MKFLADENIPELTLDLLRRQEVDIVSILSVGTGVKDRDVLRIANEQDRLLVTFDKDFGGLVFSARVETKGVVLHDILATKLLNSFMEMNCVHETFTCLSGLNAIA